MSLLAMVTVSWPLAKNILRGVCGNNLHLRALVLSCVSDTFESSRALRKWLLNQAECRLQTCRQNQTRLVIMCQQPPASGFRLTNSQVC